ncbi:Tat-binding like [Heracleum sosnowskyi]|uniref:Tat-binding like n=1 Tax=Heracleum sosnowskyi TaxID=360622 RepID=A0AAD8MZ65_9APIA|nr:Tat-binding like [Heracleum sosnowskyi]
MGSLMAGWDSHVPDPWTVKHQMNHSLTREEIDTYWKSKKQTEEEHTQVVSKETGADKSYQRSSSVPLSNTKERFLDMESDDENEVSLQNLILKNGWWTSSSSAFLNEPPVISEGGRNRHNKYASQFHVADVDASKPHLPSTGIST